MTEIERLLNEGFIQDDFINEEERCGFTVTTSRKKIWAIELDLLKEFDRVCKKHGLTYYVIAGSALGAARHHGFIPWDDDIDVAMVRSEYEKLCEIGPSEFDTPYFFQTHYTDFGAMWGHAKLRNGFTTCISGLDINYKRSINQGIFLDIFPMDNVIDDEKLFEKQKKWADFYRRNAKRFAYATNKGFRYHSNKKTNTLYKILAILFGPINHILSTLLWKRFEAVCQRYNNRDTDNFSLLSFEFNKKWMQSRNDYTDITYLAFEFIEVPVCKNYEHSLSMLYGDWHKFVRGGSQHEGFYVDADLPYQNFFIRRN